MSTVEVMTNLRTTGASGGGVSGIVLSTTDRSHTPSSRAKVALALGFVTCLFAAVPPVHAEGIKVGTARLYPSLETETHHVVNPGYLTEDGPADFYFVARPKAKLERPSDKLALQISGELEYRRFTGAFNTSTQHLSTFTGMLDAGAHLNKLGAVSLRLREVLIRQADAANQTTAERLRHVSNEVGAGLDLRPGGGALLLALDDALFYDRYDRDQNSVTDPAALDTLHHRPTIKATWKFLPRTALFIEGVGILASYPGGGGYPLPDGGIAKNVPVNILLAQAGAVGAVTARVNALLKLGYGDNFAPGIHRYRSAVGQLEVTYAASETAKLQVGYVRSLLPTSLFVYFAYDRVYGGLTLSILGQTNVAAHLEYSHLRYGAPVAPPVSKRMDRVFSGNFLVEHHFRDWLALALVDRIERRSSSYVGPTGIEAGYVFHDVLLRLAVHFDELTALAME